MFRIINYPVKYILKKKSHYLGQFTLLDIIMWFLM